jgi:putative SOS response-associated peptidase YedK
MCSRFTLRARLNASVNELRELLLGEEPPDDWDAEPACNVCPTHRIAVVRTADGRRELVKFQWGRIPSWATDPKIGMQCLNARAETVHEKPAFRSAFRKRRCLILADGYFEWVRREAVAVIV